MENWRPVVGYEGIYSVSDQGRVRGEARVVAHILKGKRLRQRILNPRINKATGYPAVNLARENSRRTFTVHSLVAAAFIGPRPEGLEVAHGDGDRSNASALNLRYATHLENHSDMRKHGTVVRGENRPHSKLTDTVVAHIRSSGRLLRELAADLGVSESTISNARRGITWSHLR